MESVIKTNDEGDEYQDDDYYASSIDKLEGSAAHVESIKSPQSKYTDQQTINTDGNKYSSKRYDD